MEWRLSPPNHKLRVLEVVCLSATFKVAHQQRRQFGLRIGQRRGKIGIEFVFAAALLTCDLSPPKFQGGQQIEQVGALFRTERKIDKRGDFGKREVISTVQAAAPPPLR